MAAIGAATIPAIDDYIAQAAPFAQPVLRRLREVVHDAVPGVQKAIKWSRPFFLYRGVILANMAAFQQHCSFGLWGAEIASTLRQDGVASAESMGSFAALHQSRIFLPARIWPLTSSWRQPPSTMASAQSPGRAPESPKPPGPHPRSPRHSPSP